MVVDFLPTPKLLHVNFNLQIDKTLQLSFEMKGLIPAQQ